MENWVILTIHQIMFQGMFVVKNITLQNRLGKKIRGKNKEALFATIYFALYIFASLLFSFISNPPGKIDLIEENHAIIASLPFIVVSLLISAWSLKSLKDSWRVGVPEKEKTELITTGAYRFTRNPYFVSYTLMFAGYTILLQNYILLGGAIASLPFIHMMILKEEKHLASIHSENWVRYKKLVPRYIWF